MCKGIFIFKRTIFIVVSIKTFGSFIEGSLLVKAHREPADGFAKGCLPPTSEGCFRPLQGRVSHPLEPRFIL